MSDSEQDNYTLDEMMQRLKSRGHGGSDGEPELVTRDDGTQVVRVRKRKRRSRQPHKEVEAQRRRRSLIIASIVGAVVLAAGLGMLGWMVALNGAGYRDEVLERAEEWTGAEVSMRSFRATPISVGLNEFEATWPESYPVASLKANGIEGGLKISSHITDVWNGESLRARSGRLVLREATAPAAGESLLPDGALPFRAPFRVSRLNVRFGEGERPALVLSDSSASLTVPDPEVAESNLILEGGKARVGALGRFNLHLASFGLTAQGFRLSSMRMSPEKYADSEIQLAGEGYPVIPLRGGRAAVGMTLSDVPAEVLFGEGFAGLVNGSFDTPNEDESSACRFDPTDLSELELDGIVRVSETSRVELRKFAMLGVLAEAMGNPRLERPRFRAGSRIEFSRRMEGVHITNLDLRAEGLMRMRGEIRVSGGELSGEIEIGLPETPVKASRREGLAELFDRSEARHRWATVRLSGTVDEPADDLRESLDRASRGEFDSEDESGAGAPDSENRFRDLTSPDE